MRTITIIAITIIVITLVLIGTLIKVDIDYGEKEGLIVDKKYNSAFTTMMYSGKVLIPHYHPERYQFKLKKEVNEKELTIWVSVDKYTYYKHKIRRLL